MFFVCTWVYACACQQSYSLAHRCAPAVHPAPTLLRRLSNQSASKPPASSTLISGTAGRTDGCLTEAERTVEEVREEGEGKGIEEDEQQEEREERTTKTEM